MPCMNSTSACDNGGSVAFVEDDSVLLGLPGAPGCTTTGGVADSLCCARVGAQRKAVAALAARSIPHSAPAPIATLNFFPRRKLYISPSASQLNIFNALTLNGSGETQRRRNAVSTFKIPGIFVESGQAGATQAATVTAKQNITMLRLSPRGSIGIARDECFAKEGELKAGSQLMINGDAFKSIRFRSTGMTRRWNGGVVKGKIDGVFAAIPRMFLFSDFS